MKRMDHENLPQTRGELLGRLLRFRLGTIILLSLFLTLFMLPLLAWEWLIPTFLFSYLPHWFIQDLVLYLGSLGFYVVFGVAMAGVLHAMCRLAWNESQSIGEDLHLGMNREHNRFALIYLYIGLLFGLFRLAVSAIGHLQLEPVWHIVSMSALVIWLVFSFLFLAYLQTAIISERLRFLSLFVPVARSLFQGFWQNFIVGAIILVPFVAFVFVELWWIKIVIVALVAIFGFGFNALILTLHSHALFDHTIHLSGYQSLIRKGLRDQEEPVGK